MSKTKTRTREDNRAIAIARVHQLAEKNPIGREVSAFIKTLADHELKQQEFYDGPTAFGKAAVEAIEWLQMFRAAATDRRFVMFEVESQARQSGDKSEPIKLANETATSMVNRLIAQDGLPATIYEEDQINTVNAVFDSDERGQELNALLDPIYSPQTICADGMMRAGFPKIIWLGLDPFDLNDHAEESDQLSLCVKSLLKVATSSQFGMSAVLVDEDADFVDTMERRIDDQEAVGSPRKSDQEVE